MSFARGDMRMSSNVIKTRTATFNAKMAYRFWHFAPHVKIIIVVLDVLEPRPSVGEKNRRRFPLYLSSFVKSISVVVGL